MVVVMEQPPGIEALRRAVEIFETQVALAKAIGVQQSRISEVLNGESKGIPAEWCPKIEAATEGRVTRSELRPDLWSQNTEAAQ